MYVTYQFSLKTCRIFFLPLSVLKFCFEVPYIHHQARHSTWQIIFLSSKKCYWITLLIIALSLSSPMIHIFSVLSETFFKCQIFRLTSKNLFFALSFHFFAIFSTLSPKLPIEFFHFCHHFSFNFQKFFYVLSMFLLWCLGFVSWMQYLIYLGL